MTDITLTSQQAQAIRTLTEWYRNRRATQQIARLFGYAGVGKTTITRYIIEELGLCRVCYAAFTGKAALVMTRAGTPATTIHQLCYKYQQPTEAIDRLSVEIADILKALAANEGPQSERRRLEVQLRRLRHELSQVQQPRFSLNLDSPVRDADLVVLDECSMVDDMMADDLMSFGKPILVLGDPGQLPPIRGEGAFTTARPDAMLTEIHRQARDSPILRMATAAREGRPIPMGADGRAGRVPLELAQPERLLKVDQVLCGKNVTRLDLNLQMRKALGLGEKRLPSGHPDDKIIVLRNWHAKGLLNGQFVTLRDVEPASDISVRAAIDGYPSRLPLYTGHFEEHRTHDPDRDRRDWRRKKHMVEATWGYAITVHKAQGSQWPTVAIIDDGFLGWHRAQRNRWLYTAVTRAQEGLVIYG